MGGGADVTRSRLFHKPLTRISDSYESNEKETLSSVIWDMVFYIIMGITISFAIVHIGVVMVFNIMIGQYTPPMGMSLFIMRGITGISLTRISLAVAPFLIPLVTALMIMTYVPEVVLLVPRALGF